MLQSALNSLQSFDRSLDKFLAWLSEAESCMEAVDNEAERTNSTTPHPQHHLLTVSLRQLFVILDCRAIFQAAVLIEKLLS